jgi:hypothetical protein
MEIESIRNDVNIDKKQQYVYYFKDLHAIL